MRRVETILIVLSLIFYSWFVAHFGSAQIFSYLRLAGWGLALTISLEAVARFVNTVGWRVTICDCPPSLGMTQLFFTRIAGEAVDYVTPSAQLGGQFVMAMMVRHKLRMPVGLATVVIAALAEVAGQIGFITLAILISLNMIPPSTLLWPIHCFQAAETVSQSCSILSVIGPCTPLGAVACGLAVLAALKAL